MPMQVAAGGHLSAALHSSGRGCLIWGKGIGSADQKGAGLEIFPVQMPSGDKLSIPSDQVQ